MNNISLWKQIIALFVIAGLQVVLLSGCDSEQAHDPEAMGNLPPISRQPQEVPGGSPERGARLLGEYGCGSCHTIPGLSQADGRVGPPLNFWADRQYIAGNLPNTPDNLIYWIRFPQAVEPGTVMPNLEVAEEDARHMAAYLFTLTGERDLTHRLERIGAAIGGIFTGQDEPAPVTGENARLSMGEQIYNNICANCHQENGQGRGDFPPLVGSALLTQEDPTGAIQIVLHGGNVMPAFHDRFSDEEIAAVLSYIRSAWDNSAPPVNAVQVSELR